MLAIFPLLIKSWMSHLIINNAVSQMALLGLNLIYEVVW